jgi:hypothetical protein
VKALGNTIYPANISYKKNIARKFAPYSALFT